MADTNEKPRQSAAEETVLAFWKKERIFEKTLTKHAPNGDFVFWEGPPTANGKPGIHHVLARTFKDVILRFKTMQGYRVLRKAGWDTHGLPVELEVEKALGISGKRQIENIVPGDKRASIISFNRRSRLSVWKYQEEWERLTERIGFWLDLNNSYITYEPRYIETIWWILSRLHTRDLLEKGYKCVPYCSRCGTTLSSHEVAQGYKDDTEDPSVYVRFRLKDQTTDLLVWTTTPWTLPGNVALAVNPEEQYAEVEIKSTNKNSKVILAKKRLETLRDEYEIVHEFLGSELVGKTYAPLYPITDSPKAYQIVAADFVSMSDGTGIVHIAPAFGQEDFELGKNLGLPVLRTVDEAGLVTTDRVVPGEGLFVKDADQKIIEDLQSRGQMFRSETIRHTYPFCWRCNTPLIYYARDSWYIKMSTLREQLLKRNAHIDWVPEHLRDGRFGEWLKEVKDWAISRDRYWGTPLPIWECEENNSHVRVIGSFDDLRLDLGSRNKFFFLRHGEGEHTVKGLIDGAAPGLPLTDKGRAAITALVPELKKFGITKIIASPFDRTKETARIVSTALGIELQIDDRLREMDFGVFNGRPVTDWQKARPDHAAYWTIGADEGETWTAVERRMVEAIGEYNSQYQGENILIVSHGDPLYVLFRTLADMPKDQMETIPYPKIGEVRSEYTVSLFDPHRPYIDDVLLECDQCQGVMRRTPDVLDVWFDSGAMPYAQWYWKGQGIIGPDAQTSQYPADYIAEAIDQTRGWFYTLLAVATALGDDLPEAVRNNPPYKHVISLGHILDADGQKMSKSKGNVINPWTVIDQYGADALRLYMVSMNQPGDAKRFSTDGLSDTLRRSLMLLANMVQYLKTYEAHVDVNSAPTRSAQALDTWLSARERATIHEVTEALASYDPFRASRIIIEFINDSSTWYLRRSRGRTDTAFFTHFRQALRTTTLLLAPLCPFMTETLWSDLKTGQDPVSIHLATWPLGELNPDDIQVVSSMDHVRRLVELGHAARGSLGIKLRQPLGSATIMGTQPLADNIADILKEELNIKEIVYIPGETLAVRLDPTISPALHREGTLRELTRHIQALRKTHGLVVGQPATVVWAEASDVLADILRSPELAKSLSATTLQEVTPDSTQVTDILTIEGERVRLGITNQL